MTRSDRERRDAEKAARRAKRLADRAEQRAERKGEQAQRAADRAEELAERAYRRKSPKDRAREFDRSIEDIVDDVADKWSRKAEDWIDDQSHKLFENEPSHRASGEGKDSAQVEARRARKQAELARKAAEEAAAYAKMSNNTGRKASGRSPRHKSHRRSFDYKAEVKSRFDRSRRRKWRRYGNLYRDTHNKKVLGVCSGSAEYFGIETWHVRMGAVLGLIFLPSLTVPAYFITYFLMDKKPYYREMSDRYDERNGYQSRQSNQEARPMRDRKPDQRSRRFSPEDNGVSNGQAMRTARQKFSDIEGRLRSMETHITSSQFELKRELKKISGDEA